MDYIPLMCYAPTMERLNEKKQDGFKGEWMFVLPTETFQAYAEHPQVRRLYLTDVGFFPHAAQHYRERKEGIEEYIFIYCMEGSGIIELNGGTRIVLKENEAFCIPGNCGHKYYACQENPWSILWVHFKGEDVAYYPLEECRVVKFQSINSSSRMLSLFELLLRVLGGNYTLGNFIYISQVLSLILGETYFREKDYTTLEQNKHVTNVIRFMYKHLQENLTLEEVAREFDFSKSYLHAIFQKYTQHAPMDFYIQLKIKEACKLLRSTDLYIYEIGMRLGYKDQYYFSRIFKKVTGVSPKEYRENGAVHYEE
ncbi:MAG: AraC family transcriptional regulator [Eubacteriales bacterium]|nr:AraC family transcriptional regulator [Eubacteriales bacterium]